MTHDHSFQLFSLCHSKIQTQTNCKEVWPCSTQCIFHCLGGDDAKFTESIVDALRKSAFHHAELRTCLSMRVWRMAWATSKVVAKLCLEQELEQSTKIERIHQDLHKIQVYSSQGLRFIWPLHCKKTRKPTPNWPLPWQSIRCYMPRSQFLCHLSCLLEIDWSTLTLTLAYFGIKHLAQFEPFYQFILQNCYNLCPQLAKNLNLELSNKSPSVHKRNVLGFVWARKFFGRSNSRLPTVSTIIGVRFSSKSWKQFCVSSKTEHGQWRTHSSTEEKSCTTPAAAPPQHACRGQI